MTWCAYTKSKVPYLNITVFWCGDFLGKKTLTYLIKQALHVHFIEPINWLGLYLSYNWIVQSIKVVSAIFLYQQMIVLKKLRKILFISSKKLFFCSQDIQIFIFLSSPLFPFVSHCSRRWQKLNPKVYDVISCLNKNLNTFYLISWEGK